MKLLHSNVSFICFFASFNSIKSLNFLYKIIKILNCKRVPFIKILNCVKFNNKPWTSTLSLLFFFKQNFKVTTVSFSF